MKMRGVLVYTSWSHVDLQTNNRRYDPKLGIADLGNKEIREIEIPSGARVTIEVASRRFCTFKKNDEKYCLAPVYSANGMPYCRACMSIIPSIKCLMGEPQCNIKDAPRSKKCIISGFYKDICTVPRYHYLLVYPMDHNMVYLKVGIERETIHPNRILEQGAPVIAIYAKTPNIWIGRKVEVSSRLFLEQFVGKAYRGLKIGHASEKKRSIIMIERLIRSTGLPEESLDLYMESHASEGIFDKLTQIAMYIGKSLTKEFREYSVDVNVIKGIEIYDMRTDLLRYDKIEEVGNFKDNVVLKGTSVGWLGSYLLLKEKNALRIVDFRKIKGHLITITIEN